MTLGDLRPKQPLQHPLYVRISYLVILTFEFITSIKFTFLTNYFIDCKFSTPKKGDKGLLGRGKRGRKGERGGEKKGAEKYAQFFCK